MRYCHEDKKAFALLLSLTLVFGFGYFIGHESNPALAQSKNKEKALFASIRDQQIFAVSQFNDGQLFAIHRKSDKPAYNDASFTTSEVLSLYDAEGKEIFAKRDFVIDEFSFVQSGGGSAQLWIVTNGGGTDSSLEIYGLKNGRFEAIIDTSKTQFRGGYLTVPEYRTGVKSPYFRLPQIILIQQIGGSDDSPSATVFRTSEGKYKPVGEINMRDLGDFIEKQIEGSKKERSRPD